MDGFHAGQSSAYPKPWSLTEMEVLVQLAIVDFMEPSGCY